MTTASLALPFTALLDEDAVAALRRRAVRIGNGIAFAASSLAMAAFLWLLLAGPGFTADKASTVAARSQRVAQR